MGLVGLQVQAEDGSALEEHGGPTHKLRIVPMAVSSGGEAFQKTESSHASDGRGCHNVILNGIDQTHSMILMKSLSSG